MGRAEELKLIKRAARGDKAAAEYFVRTYQHSLYGYLYRLSGQPEMAEDIVQDAFVRVLTNLDRFDPRFRFSTWLFTIARRLFLNAVQKHKPSYNSDLVGLSAGAAPVQPARMSDDSGDRLRDELQRALMTLSVEQREVLILFHQQDWPIWLVAQHLGLPEGTVKSHLHRGRKRLREEMLNSADGPRYAEEVLQ